MKKLIYVLFIIVISCQREDIVPAGLNSDYIVFGHFYGECGGEGCIEIYKLTVSNLFEDSNDQYPNTNEPYNGNFQLLDNSFFEKVNNLRTQIPHELLETKSVTIGQPDAGDWGGIYFEISIEGEKQFWLIDKMRMNLPEYLKPFVDEIENNIYLINN